MSETPRKTGSVKHRGKPVANFTRKRKFGTDICEDKMTFQECEIAILRHAVDEMDTKRGERTANSPDVVKMIRIVEEFLIDKKLICYGGTAINNILPKHAQFYNKNVEVPDYDFFSPTALEHAKELADIFYRRGYDEVEAKTGVHEGTYKVFVNFIPVADITFIHPTLYSALKRDAIQIAGIRYAPANYLRMGMFLELSRPEGDVSRWEKVLKRLNLLNKYHPLRTNGKCAAMDFRRPPTKHKNNHEKLYYLTRDSFIDQGVVFFGGFAASLFGRYMSDGSARAMFEKRIPDFDILAENPERCATILKDTLHENGVRNIKLVQHTALGEVVPEHIEVIAERETIAFIYRPISCHSYNTITIDQKEVNIATIDTMLSFYLAFLYADKKYYNKDRILCMSAFLFQVEQHNRLAQKGVLKRFSTKCYGKQPTLEDMRAQKNQLFKELSKHRKSPEYERAFLKYDPKTNPQLKRDTISADIPIRKKPVKTHVISENNRDESAPKPSRPSPSPSRMIRNRRKSYRTNPRKNTPLSEKKEDTNKDKEDKDKNKRDNDPDNTEVEIETEPEAEADVASEPETETTSIRPRAKSSWMSRMRTAKRNRSRETTESDETPHGQFLF